MTIQKDSEPLIDADHAAFILRNPSMTAAACGADNIPSQCRATGCRISPDRRSVTVFFSATKAASLLRDIERNGMIAVVFSEPPTHRTVQLKGRDARIGELAEGDVELAASYRESFAQILAPLGYSPQLILTALACPPDDLVAVSFTPAEAFSQTPGPNAGAPLRSELRSKA